MRNRLGILRRLRFVSVASCGYCSRHCIQHEETSKFVRNLKLRGFSDKVAKSIEAIWKYRSGNAKKSKTLYLVNEEAAKEFSAMIATKKRIDPLYVAEINSGLGFLTRELLKAGVPSINMFEGVPRLIPNLVSIVDDYPNRANLRPVDFQHLWAVGYVDWKENSNKLKTYFGDIEKKNWEDEPAIEIIGALGDMNFIRRLTSTVIFQTALAKFGRMVLHVAVPPSVWGHLTCTNKSYYLYRFHIIIFQIIFNCELLGNLPRSAFYPHWRPPKRTKHQMVESKMEIMQNDGRLMSVVRIEPKADLFRNGLTRSDIVPLYYFVHHHLKSRSNRVIPALEKWVPGCGRTLIAHGFNIYTEFGELTPQEILNLFKLFRSWPEFKQSSFVSCMDSFLLRMDEHVSVVTESDNLEEMFEFTLDENQLPAD